MFGSGHCVFIYSKLIVPYTQLQAIQGSAGQPLPSPAPPTLPQPSLKLARPTHRPPHSHGASVQASGSCSPLPSGVRESECVSAWLGQ